MTGREKKHISTKVMYTNSKLTDYVNIFTIEAFISLFKLPFFEFLRAEESFANASHIFCIYLLSSKSSLKFEVLLEG